MSLSAYQPPEFWSFKPFFTLRAYFFFTLLYYVICCIFILLQSAAGTSYAREAIDIMGRFN